LRQLVSTINYLHEPRASKLQKGKFGLVHRDLKPENILLTDPDQMLPEIKLIDFGTAKKFQYHEFDDDTMYPIGLRERVGTLNYMAPEIIAMADNKKKEVRNHNHDTYPED